MELADLAEFDGSQMQVTVRNVSKRFGDRTVLDAVNVQFRAGGMNALVGPSGCGKTTLLGILGGLHKPDSGNVELDVRGVVSPPSSSKSVWIPQGANALGARRVVDNVAIGALAAGVGRAVAEERARAALREVGLDGREEALARHLSGGELQRVALARAIVSGRPLILADEPSASLDGENTNRLVEILCQLSVDNLIIVATHDPVVARAADMVLELRAEATT